MPDLSSPELTANLPWLSHVIRRVQSLRFGSIQIKIHDGQVVVVESLEQKRFHPASKDGDGKLGQGSKNNPEPK